MPRKKIAKTAEKENKSTPNLKTDIFDIKGEVVGKISLSPEIFAAKVNPFLIAQAVRVYQSNKRSGTHSTKTRATVAGSTKKIYRQKGTGRARHGAITAPIFKGGGVAHGPHPTDYSMNLPQKMKRAALFSVLTDKMQNGALTIVRGLEKIEIKTRIINETLLNLKLSDKNKKAKIFLITPQNSKNIILSARNIEYLTVGNARLLNAYDVLTHKKLLFMEESISVLENQFLSKENLETKSPAEKISEKQKVKSSAKTVSPKIRKTVKKPGIKKTVKRKKAAPDIKNNLSVRHKRP